MPRDLSVCNTLTIAKTASNCWQQFRSKVFHRLLASCDTPSEWHASRSIVSQDNFLQSWGRDRKSNTYLGHDPEAKYVRDQLDSLPPRRKKY